MTTRRAFIATIGGLVLPATARVLLAQDKSEADFGVTLFEHVDFGGGRITIERDLSDFKDRTFDNDVRINDATTSLQVLSNTYAEVFDNPFDSKNQRVLQLYPGESKADLGFNEFNDCITSIKVYKEVPATNGKPCQITVYRDANRRGPRKVLKGPHNYPDLAKEKYEDSDDTLLDNITSIDVEGAFVRVFDNALFGGKWASLFPLAYVSDTETIGMNDNITSIKIAAQPFNG